MSDENINPQNIPIQPQENNLTDNKPRLLNLRKTIPIALVIVLIIGIPVSLFLFFKQTKPNIPPEPLSTITPKATDIPAPSQKTGEYIITIKLGETIIIPDTSISLTYKSANIPGENCYDCTSSTTLEVKNNNQEESLIYLCGGFTGECTTMQEAYGYEFEIIGQLDKDTLELKIKKTV